MVCLRRTPLSTFKETGNKIKGGIEGINPSGKGMKLNDVK
jgi:hypothetical protein